MLFSIAKEKADPIPKLRRNVTLRARRYHPQEGRLERIVPRPSKHVSPDTLGGRIRAAREDLHLSLAEVANGQYSTSLISQIERNRVDPSQDSLRFLADRLQLPMHDLEALAHQHRETEVEAHHFKSIDEFRLEAEQLLKQKKPQQALDFFQNMHFSQVPALQRWRLAALRGQCYFELRHHLLALQDFIYALQEQPQIEGMSAIQKHELMLLHLHLASTYRELEREEAFQHYQTTLQMMNSDTPFGYVAEAHWGLAIIAFVKAYKLQSQSASEQSCRVQSLQTALEHAEIARVLYRSIGEPLRAAAITCQIAQIEKELGHLEKVSSYLENLLETWRPTMSQASTFPNTQNPQDPQDAEAEHLAQEQANVVSAAACTLAGLALDAGHIFEAQRQVQDALQAGARSYPARLADAYIMHGRILEALDPTDPAIETTFRRATEVLATTDRMGMRISAHTYLGRYFFYLGKMDEGNLELEKARLLANIVSASSTIFHDMWR